MDKSERNYIYLEIKPEIYVRYVDDTGTTVHTEQEALEMLAYLKLATSNDQVRN